jgi:hypothetical protein
MVINSCENRNFMKPITRLRGAYLICFRFWLGEEERGGGGVDNLGKHEKACSNFEEGNIMLCFYDGV